MSKLDSLVAWTPNGVRASWKAPKADAAGVSITRENLTSGDILRLGGFPATVAEGYIDATAPSGSGK